MKALLVIDMLNDFVKPEGKLYIGENSGKVLEYAKRIVGNFRAKGEQIIFICDEHRKNDKEFLMFPPHCIAGTHGAEVVDELSPADSDIIIKKRRYSAFFGTQLDLTLREAGIYELVLVGVCTNICVLYTAADARNLGYKVCVPKDGVASFDHDAHEFALKEMSGVLGVLTEEEDAWK